MLLLKTPPQTKGLLSSRECNTKLAGLNFHAKRTGNEWLWNLLHRTIHKPCQSTATLIALLGNAWVSAIEILQTRSLGPQNTCQPTHPEQNLRVKILSKYLLLSPFSKFGVSDDLACIQCRPTKTFQSMQMLKCSLTTFLSEPKQDSTLITWIRARNHFRR